MRISYRDRIGNASGLLKGKTLITIICNAYLQLTHKVHRGLCYGKIQQHHGVLLIVHFSLSISYLLLLSKILSLAHTKMHASQARAYKREMIRKEQLQSALLARLRTSRVRLNRVKVIVLVNLSIT